MIRKSLLASVFVACGLAVAGCSENLKSIYRTVEIESGKGPSIIIGAKQRIITNLDIVDTSVSGQVLPKRIVCAEPSPDVAQGISQAIQAGFEASKGDGKAGASGQFGFSSAAAVAQLGERLATIQLLRDQSYRACEAYANGAINATGYTILNSRLNKTMVTMLSSEMTAGAFGRAVAQISSAAATTSGDNKATADAKRQLQAAVAAQEKAQQKKDAAEAQESTDPDAVTKAETELTNAEKAVVEKAAKLTATQSGAASTSASASAGKEGTLGQISGNKLTGVSGDLTRIHRQFMNDNSFDTLLDACVTSLDFARFRKTDKIPPSESNEKIFLQTGEGNNFAIFDKAKLLEKLEDSPFNIMCLTDVIPKSTDIAGLESAGKIEVNKIRAQQEGLNSVARIVTFCAEEKNKETPGCANLDKLLVVRN